MYPKPAGGLTNSPAQKVWYSIVTIPRWFPSTTQVNISTIADENKRNFKWYESQVSGAYNGGCYFFPQKLLFFSIFSCSLYEICDHVWNYSKVVYWAAGAVILLNTAKTHFLLPTKYNTYEVQCKQLLTLANNR